jgi:hypothetical protein
MKNTENIAIGSNTNENLIRKSFLEQFKNSPIPDNEILPNLGLFTNRQTLSRILFMNELYKNIINVNGVIMEFGVRWGQNMSLFSSFRGMYEPFNHTRKIIGFDTFEGFPSVHTNDGDKDFIKQGAYSVGKNYEDYLENILNYHEKESPISHKKKFELIKGDATKKIKEYLRENPQTIIAFAYFDFDLYEPTKVCLEAILPYLTKGSIVAFDELNDPNFPGETIAFQEILGVNNYEIKRSPLNPFISYIVF